jgi:hypothetical protein
VVSIGFTQLSFGSPQQSGAPVAGGFLYGIGFARQIWVSEDWASLRISPWIAPIGFCAPCRWGFSFLTLHAFHFSIYMLKMVAYVTILGLSHQNKSAALSELEPLNYLK